MAITRTQIAKQLLAKGGRIGLKPGGPPCGGATSMGSGRDFSGPSKDSNTKNDGGSNARENYIANYVSKGIVKGGGSKIGTDAGGNPVYADARLTKSQINRAKDFRELQKFKRAFTTKTLFDKVPSTLKILSRLIPGNLKYRQEFLANNPQLLEYFNSLTEEEQKSGKLMSALKGITNLDGKTYEDFLAFDKGAPGLKYSGNVGGLEKFVKEDGTFGYTDVGNRDGADNILLPQKIAQAPSIIEEEPEYVNPLSLLSPRIAGTRFLGTEFEDEDEDKSFDLRLANGGSTNDISLQEAKDMAPKGEFLAYINKKEAKMLKDAGGSGIMTNAGIPSFVEYGGQSGFEGAKSTGSVQGDVDRGGGDGPQGPPTNIGGGGGNVTTLKSKKNIPTTNTDFMKFNTKQLVELGLVNPEDIEDENTQVAEAINFNKLGIAKDPFTPKSTMTTGSVVDNFMKENPNATKGDFVNALQSGSLGVGGSQLFDKNVDALFEGVNLGKSMSPFDVTPTFQGTTDGSFKGNIDIEKGALEQEAVDALPKGFFIGADGGRAGLAGGGIASLDDMDREGFLLGGIAKGLKKAVRGVKKLAKSPIGKAALGFAAFKYGKGLGIMDKFNNLSKLQQFGVGVGVPSILAGLMTPKKDEDKFDIDSYYASSQLDPSQSIRGMGSEFDFYGGQRIASAEGGATEKKEPVAKKVMPLIDMDGKEKDYRETGGFVDMGRMEKADDVPARLSKNEFVFTADAVRNAGDGSVDKGSEVMYNMMKNLESGGDVSEESQGLDGARKMFQTSQRLEEVL